MTLSTQLRLFIILSYKFILFASMDACVKQHNVHICLVTTV